jgi:GNAT superfamily N-acetyltransferase
MSFSIELSDAAPEEVTKVIRRPLLDYNAQRTGISDFRPLAATLRDADGRILGGLVGRTAFGWLFVELLVVPEALRGQGIGKDLMLRAEAEAVRRGCHSAWLDTFEFRAREFYEKLGYQVFGELEDYPEGFSRYFMKKVLSNDVPRA